MRKLLSLFILLAFVACDLSDTTPDVNPSLKAEPALKGIWKLVSVRYAGGNVPDMKTLYAIADPENSNLAESVSRVNANPGHINVLGFNAMNANTGSATGLVTYAFAHEFNGYCYEMYVDNMKNAGSPSIPFHCGIVPMDHYGATYFDGDKNIKVYGDKLSWAVIESNFKK